MKMYEIQWRMKAVKQLRNIPDSDGKKIREAVTKLEDPQTWGDVKRLTEHKFDYRLRVGNYRVLFNNEKTLKILTVEEVKKRDNQTY